MQLIPSWLATSAVGSVPPPVETRHQKLPFDDLAWEPFERFCLCLARLNAIAHRLSTLDRANRLIVLERGRIVEEGQHAALLSQDGVYARLCRAQATGPGDE